MHNKALVGGDTDHGCLPWLVSPPASNKMSILIHPKQWLTYDGLHPADKRNAVIANMLVKVIK